MSPTYYMTLALASVLIITACNKGDSTSQAGAVGPTPHPTPMKGASSGAAGTHPISGKPAADIPSASMDLNTTDLTSEGCLNLQMFNDRMSQLPLETLVREYTRDVHVTAGNNLPDTTAAKTRFHNMEAEVSLANLSLKIKSNREFIASLPVVEQTGCVQLVRTDQMGNHENFEIIKEEQTDVLHLRSADHLREEIYTLIGPRQLEIRILGPHVDRCPKFAKFQVTVDKIRSWGTAADLDADPVLAVRDFARNLSSSVDNTPDDVLMQLGQDDSPTIRLTNDDISQIKSQPPTESILHCPIGSTPPSSDESPPPEQTATPAPSPTPVPGATPAPGTTPVPPLPTVTPPPPQSTPDPHDTPAPSPTPAHNPWWPWWGN